MDAKIIVGGVALVAVVAYALHHVVDHVVDLVMDLARADAWAAKVLAKADVSSVINLDSRISSC